ncbi:late expression factor 3 [Apocheima cinerarium nucleopolyhedrovirus]|uniref:late expression factor 3 n=1 Tax=Apocheima cinerarium nucleopolyhedrovirus TaxID=307461 RepID=UPI0001D92082|nr:late expression factor 3 [Apocheima cinerarium nucleopolyhedrovirus]ADB84404.1 late expression factor 3 [Apocheima cinerarium nucleopolyhedrovirus]
MSDYKTEESFFENEEKNTNKRKNEDENCEEILKRVKLQSPEKKSFQRSMSVSSNSSSSGAVRRGISTIKGLLISKNTMSINNEPFYLFKFLVNNVNKNYYGDAGQYHSMKEDQFYEVVLDYVNKKICIGTFTKCANTENVVEVKKWLNLENFEANDNVSVYAKFKFGFKLIDNNTYKMIFHILVGNSLDSAEIKEIECTTNFDKVVEVFKDAIVSNENNLLAFLNDNIDKVMKLHRIKCNKTNGANDYKSFSIQSMTEITVAEDIDIDFENTYNIQNISRKNKKVLHFNITKLDAELINGATSDRFLIMFQIEGGDTTSKANYFNNSYGNNDAGKTANKFQRLEAELNQLNDLIENDIVKVSIYVTMDTETNNFALLGITKLEIDTETYQAI